VLSFYIKLNTGLIGFIFLIGHLINLVISKIIKIDKAIIVLVILSGFFGFSLLLFNVSLPGYFKGALEIVKGYNDVMSLNEEHTYIESGSRILYFALLSLYIIHAFFLVRQKKYSQLFFFCDQYRICFSD